MQPAIIAENCPDLDLLDPYYGNRRAEPKLPPPPFILEEPEWEYIDPAIVNVIRQLYQAGISTLESCQGGPGHRVHFPNFSCDARHDFQAEVLPVLETFNLTVLHRRVEYIPGVPLFHKVTLNHWPELPYEHPDERTTMLVRLLFHLGTYLPTTPESRLETPSDPPLHYGLYDPQPYGDLLWNRPSSEPSASQTTKYDQRRPLANTGRRLTEKGDQHDLRPIHSHRTGHPSGHSMQLRMRLQELPAPQQVAHHQQQTPLHLVRREQPHGSV